MQVCADPAGREIMTASYLELSQVGIEFDGRHGKFRALDEINLSLNRGEFVSLIGHSGCGKSTLLKLIAGFIRPDSGQILKNGKLIKGADLDRIMLFQNFEQLFPWKTVLGNVIFALKASSTADKESLKETYNFTRII